MGRMPPGLARYWAKKRGRKAKAARTGFRTKVAHMARRRYFGKRRAGGRTTIPIMGIATAGALAGGILLQPSGHYGGTAPITQIAAGEYSKGGANALGNLKNPNTYLGLAVPVAVWIVGRMLLGKRKISKRVSIF